MAPKKTNIKIKRSKINLYNKKKSKGKRALKVVATVLAIGGLGVLGYGLGKPLMKYFNERGNTASDPASALYSSILNSVNEQSQAEQSAAVISTASSADETSKPSLISTAKIYYLPENAAQSEAALNEALSKAKSSGCSIVAVTLKDTKGCLQYQTGIEALKGTDAVLPNALPPQQIASAISREGFTPAARVNTLMDQLGCYYVKAHYQLAPDHGNYTWHDNTEEKGGKAWMSPFKTESRVYMGNITSELTQAGFRHIICANTRFPAFHSVDITKYLSNLPLTDMPKRSEALWSVIDAIKAKTDAGGAKLWIEISGTNLVAEKKDCTDAELTTDKAKLTEVNLVVIYDIVKKTNTAQNTNTSQSGNTAQNTANANNTNQNANTNQNGQNANTTSTPAPAAEANAYAAAKGFAAKAKAALGGAEFAVRIPENITGKDLDDIRRALTEEGIAVF